MNLLAHLQEMDDIIIEHTQPPITAMLRNKLAFCIEQAGAHMDAVERQSKTLATQMVTIERFMKENADMVKTIANSDAWRELENKAAECDRIIRKNSTLNWDYAQNVSALLQLTD